MIYTFLLTTQLYVYDASFAFENSLKEYNSEDVLNFSDSNSNNIDFSEEVYFRTDFDDEFYVHFNYSDTKFLDEFYSAAKKVRDSNSWNKYIDMNNLNKNIKTTCGLLNKTKEQMDETTFIDLKTTVEAQKITIKKLNDLLKNKKMKQYFKYYNA